MKQKKIVLDCDCEGQTLEICYDYKDDIPDSHLSKVVAQRQAL